MKLLHVDSSILGPNSVSRLLSAEIVAEQRKKHPDIEVTYQDLTAAPLPHLSPLHIAAWHGAAPDDIAVQDDLTKGAALIDTLFASDIIVIGAPMYNFGIPSQLKAWIDRLLIAGKTFHYTERGPEGLVPGRQEGLPGVGTRGRLWSRDAGRLPRPPGDLSEGRSRLHRPERHHDHPRRRPRDGPGKPGRGRRRRPRQDRRALTGRRTNHRHRSNRSKTGTEPMHKRTSSLAFAFLLAAAAPAFAQAVTDPSKVEAGTYAVDPNHTEVMFKVSHMGFSNYSGVFFDATGELKLDPKDPSASSLKVSVPVATVTTSVAKLTEELKSPAWIDAGKFPEMTFVSKKVTLDGTDKASVAGDLTLHGVTKPFTLAVKFVGAGMNPLSKKYTVGFEAEGDIMRSDFGVKTYVPLIGDKTHISINGAFQK